MLKTTSPILTPELLPPGALKLPAAARYLSISEMTLRRLIKSGRIRPNRDTRHLLLPVEELNRFLRG